MIGDQCNWSAADMVKIIVMMMVTIIIMIITMMMMMNVRLCCQMANGSASKWLTEAGARKRGSLNWFQFFSYLALRLQHLE